MDFEEFLWAMGDEMLMPYIRMRFDKRLPMEAFHRRAMDYFRQYLIVGGMPQAVLKYVETRDFEKVDEVKRDILALYRNDIHKYADNQETKLPPSLRSFRDNCRSMKRSLSCPHCRVKPVCVIIRRLSSG